MGQPSHGRNQKERPTCTYCGYEGHVIDRCYKLHGYPPGYKPKQKPGSRNYTGFNPHSNNNVANQISCSVSNQSQGNTGNFMQTLNHDQCQQLMSMLSTHLTTSKMDDEVANVDHVSGTILSVSINQVLNSPRHWVLDSGATSHVCFNRACFHTLKAVQDAYITLPNHAMIRVNFVGHIKLTLDLVLEDVLYVPQFKFNLLSISALTKRSSISIKFLTDGCDIQDLYNLRMIGKGRRVGGLYILDSTMKYGCNSVKHICNSDSVVMNNVDSYTWHNRLGHLSFKRLAGLKEQLHFKCNKGNEDVPCSICPLTKQRRLSFVSNNHLSPNAFDLVHADTWGPYSSPTREGHRYFLTLVDDCIRFAWVYLIKQKSDVLAIIPKFFCLVETQFIKVIKAFRSDNAPELQFTDFF